MYSPRRIPFAVTLFASFTLILLLCAAGVAQGPSNTATESTTAETAATASGLPDSPPARANTADDTWKFDVAPYAFIPGVHGTVGLFGHDASIHASGSDLLSNFQGGIAGVVEAQKGRFLMPIDLIWTNIATTKNIPIGDPDQRSVRAEFSQFIFTPKFGYRMWDGERLKFDALFGVRYWHLGQTLTLRPSNVSRDASANWVDVLGGARALLYMTPKAWFTISSDVGAGQSDLDYQALGLVNFQPKPLLGFFVGWRYLYVDYQNNPGTFLYNVAQSGPMFGLNMQFGGKPPVPPSASCSASPTEVWAGEPVAANLSTRDFNPKHTLTYAWTSTGAKISGTGTTGNVDTAGLAPGSYGITGTATDPKEKKNNSASCNTSFTVKTPHPPTASCSASPDTVQQPGQSATLTANASSPDNFPLTYAWTSNGGQISGNGASATLNTAGAAQGSSITATATVTDSRGLSTTCNATVSIPAPPPPVVVNEVTEIGECKFMDEKRPARVDNSCKAVLDDVALKIQHEPNGKFVVVGYSEDEEVVKVKQVGAQRSVNMKYYMVNGEGGSQIDATRIDVRTSGTVKQKGAKIYFVPSGATFSEESVAVDETQVQGQARNAPAPKKKAKKAAATPAQ
jgi:hypothetical protein